MNQHRRAFPRLFFIRAMFPVISIAVLWASISPHWLLRGLVFLNFLDVLGGIIQWAWEPKLVDYRFAVIRDVIYAMAYYTLVLSVPEMPALVFVPPVLAEIFVVFGHRLFVRAVFVEMVLLAVRMTVVYRVHRVLHPTWAILIATASVIMGLLGLEITRLEELQANIVRRKEELKETLTAMLTTTLSTSGVDESLLQQEDINPMLDELCLEANQSKGREIGQRLAKVIAIQHAASNLLTSRESEVLCLIAKSNSYRQIAESLQVSEGTVRAHAASLMRKAEVHNRAELVKWARRQHLLPNLESEIHAPLASDVPVKLS